MSGLMLYKFPNQFYHPRKRDNDQQSAFSKTSFFSCPQTNLKLTPISNQHWSSFFCRNAFVSTVRRLALLRDPNVAQIIAACTQDEPLCVLSEFSDYGDLCHFLKSHQPHNLSHYTNTNDLNTSLSSGSSGTPSGLK